jgi:transketolase
MKNDELKKQAGLRRLDVLEMVYASKAGHIGGSFSSMDVLVSLYYRLMDVSLIQAGDPARDRFVLSKGHCAEALYAVLADTGFIPKEELKTFTRFGTRLAEHPTKGIPGIEIATGALGHGLSAAIGMALALKMDGCPAHVYCLMGDGEQAEGSVWEAAMAAAKYGLDNLTAIVDRNRLQISGCTEDVMPCGDLKDKYQAFGWNTMVCDGHAFDELLPALQTRAAGLPTVVIAETVKGRGSPVMENIAEWHHQIPTAEEYEIIKADLIKTVQEVSA